MAEARPHRPTRRKGEKPVARRPSPRPYRVYGLSLRSHWPLPCPQGPGSHLADLELCDAPADLFAEVCREPATRPARRPWFQHLRLPDGSDYLRWSGLFEFLVSPDGRRIHGHPLSGISREAFHAYLLGQTLSFALLKRGIEPLHATAVVIAGEAVGFLGESGYGKSSLGAAFLQAGHPLLTDDLLVLRPDGPGFQAFPGPPRIKLFPHVARRLLGQQITGAPMNKETRKLVISLGQDGKGFWREPCPLRAIYVLTPPGDSPRSGRITLQRLSPRRAFVEMLKGTFNAAIIEPARLKRQFALAARLARRLPVRSLSFPRSLALLPAVREAILSDLSDLRG